ncbi:unnamed protein product [Nezara viridula]|uniref:Uncharacterized protein n=1 Tax=Nezara viridula TaxID=85310 RepID=A0A9P0HHA7_NEZVI|nr:unnamed protein product [Nezara viridula]
MACTVPTCQAIFHGKCLNADESEFEALRALRKNWECPKCEKARKNIQPTDKCLSPPRSAPQQQTVDSTSQLLLAAIKNLTEEVKGLKFSLDANANERKKKRKKGNWIYTSLKMLRNLTYAFKSSSYVYPLVRLPLNGMKYSTKGPNQEGPTEEKLTEEGPTEESPTEEGLDIPHIKKSFKDIIKDLDEMETMMHKRSRSNLGDIISRIRDKVTSLLGNIGKNNPILKIRKDK